MKLKNKLMGGLALAVMIPMLSMLMVNDHLTRETMHASFREKVQGDLERVTRRTLPEMMNTARNYITFTALDSNFGKAAYYALAVGSQEDLVKQLSAFQERLGLSFLEVTDPTGKTVHSTLKEHAGQKVNLVPLASDLASQGYALTFRREETSGLFTLTVTAPIIQRGDQIGLLRGGYLFDAERLKSMGNGAHMVFFAEDGTPAKSTWTPNLPKEELLNALARQTSACAKDKENCQTTQMHFHQLEQDGIPYALAYAVITMGMDKPTGLVAIGQDASSLLQDLHRSRLTIASLTAAFVLLALVAGWFFAGAIARSIAMVSAIVERIAQGDLTQRAPIPARPDEIFSMAAQVNRMADAMARTARSMHLQSGNVSAVGGEFTVFNTILQEEAETIRRMASEAVASNDRIDADTMRLRENVDRMADRIETVSLSIGNLTHNIHTIAAASEQASQNVTTMASAAEEMSVNVHEVNGSLTQVNHAVNNVSHSIEKMGSSMEEVRRRCQAAMAESDQANRNADASRQMMTNLAKSAQAIGKVVEIINNIAEQTNMLALNAAIEAAGAGEAGRGFAVVSNEVKELARQTGDATGMISNQIREIQQQTRAASDSVGEISKNIQRIDHASKEIGEAVDHQTSFMDGITQDMGRVSKAASDVTRNASELNNAVQEVARAATEAAGGTTEIAHSASTLSTEAQTLNQESQSAREQARMVQGLGSDILAASAEVQMRGLQTLDAVTNIAGWIQQSDLLTKLLSGSSAGLKSVAGELNVGTAPMAVEEVKQSHLTWLAHLTHAVRTKDMEAMERMQGACDFEGWVSGEGLRRFGTTELFSCVKNSHHLLHQKELEAIQACRTGDMDQAAACVERMASQEMEAFFQALDEFFQMEMTWRV